MTMGFAATGAAVFNVVDHAGEPLETGVRWLLSGAIILALVCIALFMQSIRINAELRPEYRRGGLITIASTLAILLLGLVPLLAILLLAILVLLMLTPAFYGNKV